ncbi:MAG TPA: energy transducer TonB [Candidatus Cloacimonadota bacterium]|nr:energy transducer TonB [Candidatus Cloacimonadota bacterium]HPT70657.1 energy transducer TonB [Candidatus Cloacimonadota bacterium]
MAHKHLYDWKDVALSYLDKSFSWAILFFLFLVMVSPKLSIKPYQYESKDVITIDIPPEMREKIKPPENISKPVFNIVIDENVGGKSTGDDVGTVETIESTVLSTQMTNKVGGIREEGKTPRFVAYEDPPVVVSKVVPEYTDFARRAKIQGTVWLDVEILVDGRVGAIEVKKSLDSSPNGLDDAAKTAVRKWKFQPAKSGGKPVACWASIPVVFSLSQ